MYATSTINVRWLRFAGSHTTPSAPMYSTRVEIGRSLLVGSGNGRRSYPARVSTPKSVLRAEDSWF